MTTTYTYEALDRPKAQPTPTAHPPCPTATTPPATSASGGTTGYGYDGLNRLKTKTLPLRPAILLLATGAGRTTTSATTRSTWSSTHRIRRASQTFAYDA